MVKKILKYTVLVILVYIYLHDPFLFPTFGIFGRAQYQMSIFILYFLSLVYAIINFAEIKQLFRQFRTECLFVLFFFAFSLFVTVLGGDSSFVKSHFFTIFKDILIPFFLICLMKKWGFTSFNDCVKILLLVSAVACVGTVFLLLNEDINNVYKFFMYQGDMLDQLESNQRGFSFSSSQTYSFGIIQGAMLGFSLFFSKENKWFLLFLPLVFLSALFNARTGCVVAIAGLLLYLFSTGQKQFGVKFFLVLIGVICFLNFDKILELLGVNDSTIRWITAFFDETSSTVKSRHVVDGTASTLFGEMIVLPDTLPEWFFGKGYTYFGGIKEPGVSSDVGFINQLAYGGLFYVIPLYVWIYKMLKKIRYRTSLLFTLFWFSVFLIANIKGSFVPSSGGFNLWILVYFCIVHFQTNKVCNTLSSQ